MDSMNALQIEEEGIDFRKWFRLFIQYWLLITTCVVIGLLCALLYSNLSLPNYQLTSSILVRNDKNPLDKAQLFSATISNDPYQLENQKGILNAKSVTRKALQNLDFSTAYFVQQQFRKIEIYKNTPFQIVIDSSFVQPIGVYFEIGFIHDSLITVSASGEEIKLYDFGSKQIVKQIDRFQFDDTLRFGDKTGNAYCRFSILPSYTEFENDKAEKNFYFRFYSENELISQFRQFKIDNDKGSSILSISFKYPNPQKAADFLNSLALEYLRKGTQRDNDVAEATIGFIDAQLVDIIDSLHMSGESMQNFKSSTNAIDIGFQAEKVYGKVEQFEIDKAKLLVKKRYFNYLLENLKSKSEISDLISPTTLDINDPVLNNLILELANLYSERAEMSFNSIKNNPYLTSLELKIDDTRHKLMESSRNVLDATEIALEEIEEKIAIAEQTLNRLPKEQQKYFNIERKYKLNDELYTYLLTRRSEMEIFKASNIPVNEVLDKVEAEDAVKVSPNMRLNLMIALLFGLFVPMIIIYLIDALNNKIRDRDDIQKLTSIPVVGAIVDAKIGTIPVILNEPNSIISESYRTLRTNLQFIIDEAVSNIVLVTSAIQGEGKSFTAINMAAVYASYGKKTILLDCDLRKSCIEKNLQIRPLKGLSQYLSHNCLFEEAVFKTDQLNFDLICAGPVPPNPSELIASPVLAELIAKLKREYDIVIIDSPPIGIVSDALLIYPFVDITLSVVRYNYTTVDVLKNVLDELKNRKAEHVHIVLNDVEPRKGIYGYGYGYGYIQSEEKTKFGRKLKKWMGAR